MPRPFDSGPDRTGRRAGQPERRSIRSTAAVISALLVALTFATAGPTNASEQAHESVVGDDPADWTPQVLDGRVNALAQIGDTIYVGGAFSTVVGAKDTEHELARANLFAFDSTTGDIDTSFLPTIDGEVKSLEAEPSTGTLFIGGSFFTVNGTPSRSIASLDSTDGSNRAGFTAPDLNAGVNDVHLRGGELLVGGAFSYAGLIRRSGLASLNAATGAVTGYLDADLSTLRPGNTTVVKMAVAPDRESMIVVGNFTSAFGSTRDQIAKLSLDAARASMADWSTGWYSAACADDFSTYLRDLDFSPDGSYFVVSTTGGYGGPTSPCDSQSRFETDSTGTNEPTWVAHTGGDTTYAVAVTGTAVYVGGHMRWMNNPHASNKPGPGAVPREGIAALDPRNGIPLTWNPGRARGVGVFDMLVTDAGLWIGSDTDRVNDEVHRKLAFFPLSGGDQWPAEELGTLPNDVLLLGRPAATGDSYTSRWAHFSGDARTPADAQEFSGTGSWWSIRGALLIDDQLFAGWADGTFTRRTVTGQSFASWSAVDLYGGDFAADIPAVTGMFFDRNHGRIYYSMTGSDSLYWRGFSPQSEIVGATRSMVKGDVAALDPRRVAGMFLAGDTLYFADRSTGGLYGIGFSDGELRGPAHLVNSSIDWRSKASFVSNGGPGTAPYEPPPAATISASCKEVSCSFAASVAEGGPAVNHTWDFGDGSTGSGPTATHKYANDGSYVVSLTVSDRLGGGETTTRSVAAGSAVAKRRAVVKVRPVKSRGVLHVNVNPNMGKKYWRFRVEKRVNKKWAKRKTYRTKGPKEIRRLNLRKGTYRVVVRAKHGRLGATSSRVRLRR